MKKHLLFLGAGILFLVTTGLIYIPKFGRQGLNGIELTFLTNFSTGLLFVLIGIQGIRKQKPIAQSFLICAGSILFCVLLISLLCIGEANFSGPFLFLHVLNPLLATILIIVFTYQSKTRLLKTFVGTLLTATAYFVYVIWYGYSSGDWLYSVINVPEKGVLSVAAFYLVFAVLIPLLEFSMYRISKLFYEKTK